MNEETIKFFRDIEKLENKLTGEDKEILEKEMYMFNECARILEETEQENQQLKEENKKLKKIIKVYENPNDVTGMFENCDELKVILSNE